MIMYAHFFVAGVQLVRMQLRFNQATQPYADRGPNELCMQRHLWAKRKHTYMKPQLRQDPKMIMFAPFFGQGLN